MVKCFHDIDGARSSSHFTKAAAEERFPGPPLIGALLRMPWEVVQHRMLERLHERGFDDLDAAHLNVFQYPGPQGARPSELAARLRISKQALNYLLGELERLTTSSAGRIPTTTLQARRPHPTWRLRDHVSRGCRRNGGHLDATTRRETLRRVEASSLSSTSSQTVEVAAQICRKRGLDGDGLFVNGCVNDSRFACRN